MLVLANERTNEGTNEHEHVYKDERPAGVGKYSTTQVTEDPSHVDFGWHLFVRISDASSGFRIRREPPGDESLEERTTRSFCL